MRAEVEDFFGKLFAEVSLSGIQPSAVYDLDSIVIVAAPDTVQKAWGETSILRVNAKMDFSSQIGAWSASQQFFIRKLASNWYIFAIGQDPPPLDWKPQAIPAVAAPVPEAGQAAPEKEILDAWNGCLAAFLEKTLDASLAHMADNVHVLRMRQTVSKDEMKTTFQGYFDSTDFGNITAGDVVDEASIFVVPTKEFDTEIQGPVYVLNVKAKLDLSKDIPFWTTYQRYYFARENGDWKIFAVF